MANENFPDDEILRRVRKALEREEISLGRAAEILGITREQMRDQARAWARQTAKNPASDS